MIVAIQGEAGSYSAVAAHQALGPAITLIRCATFDALFEAVASGRAESGVVPVENTLVGRLHENDERLHAFDVHTVGETWVRVRHCLIARPGAALASLRRVASHPVALAQCRRFFAAHPRIEPVSSWDTAGAVRDLMSGALDADAVIAAAAAASLYGAAVLREGLEDSPDNATCFVVISRRAPWPSGTPRPTPPEYSPAASTAPAGRPAS
jgi:prephenate dehydratase